jgi:hypothetical protein
MLCVAYETPARRGERVALMPGGRVWREQRQNRAGIKIGVTQ